MMLQIGDKAPDFTLLDQHGKRHALADYKGNWLLLYFYPKDNTTGCIKEVCKLRDDFTGFKKLSVHVVGVSVDSVKSHKKFADDYKLPFALLADEDRKVVNLYNVWREKSMYGRNYMGTVRTSFLINPQGVIEKIYEKVVPADHSREVLEDLKQIM